MEAREQCKAHSPLGSSFSLLFKHPTVDRSFWTLEHSTLTGLSPIFRSFWRSPEDQRQPIPPGPMEVLAGGIETINTGGVSLEDYDISFLYPH